MHFSELFLQAAARNRRTYARRFAKWKHVLSIISSNLSPTRLPTMIGSDCINAAICISCIKFHKVNRSNEVPKYIPVYNAMTPENSRNRPARSFLFQKSVDKLFPDRLLFQYYWTT